MGTPQTNQMLVAVDQLINAFTWLREDGFGMADETLSARAYRLRNQHPLLMRTIDTIFFWDKDHCLSSYVMELHRKHLPPIYNSETLQ